MAKKKKEVKAPDLTQNFIYFGGIDYNCDYDTHCHSNGCDEEGICRCGTISNARISMLDMGAFVTSLCRTMNIKKTDPTLTEKLLWYSVDRLCRIYKLYNKDSWRIDVGGGYYGEEINGIYLENREGLSNALDLLIASDNPVELILKEEYGFLIPEVADQKWIVEKVDLKPIKAQSVGQMRKVDRETTNFYTDYEGIVAVCIKAADGSFRLIDGYHRLAAQYDDKKKVEIITNV